jgi:hypothetical protein
MPKLRDPLREKVLFVSWVGLNSWLFCARAVACATRPFANVALCVGMCGVAGWSVLQVLSLECPLGFQLVHYHATHMYRGCQEVRMHVTKGWHLSEYGKKPSSARFNA